ncbi:hypothetical protein WJX84_004765 [Apatococcus fuscideae]|uniref:Uncharacterized protein n=1 Tax=Apatococcus fuscideae TaxID=2026836 RepID=A0AAW1SK20_9CHLO
MCRQHLLPFSALNHSTNLLVFSFRYPGRARAKHCNACSWETLATILDESSRNRPFTYYTHKQRTWCGRRGTSPIP